MTRKPVATTRVEAGVLRVIDAEAERRGVTRSQLLAALAEVFADTVTASGSPSSGLRPVGRHRTPARKDTHDG